MSCDGYESYEECSRDYLIRRIAYLEHQLATAKATQVDKLAQAAMNGFCSTVNGDYDPIWKAIAQDAYAMADAMMEVKNERNVP